ncbi:MAG: hypothetical protein ACRERE_15700 [Candidatus Entotheonellia bacterium]
MNAEPCVNVRVEDPVLRPVNEVFAAIVDPAKMSHCFISGGSGPMNRGTTHEKRRGLDDRIPFQPTPSARPW